MTDRELRKRLAAVRAIAPLALRSGPSPEVGSVSNEGLEDAARVLDSLAAGEIPDRTAAIVGALALDALPWTLPGRDLLDAAAGLAIIATGGVLELDEAGRFRARHLAKAVRAISGGAREALPATSRASNYS
jgi:hypothetical protein